MNSNWTSFVKFISKFLKDAPKILTNPQSDPTKALIIIAVFSVILVILFLVFVIFYMLVEGRRPQEEPAAPEEALPAAQPAAQAVPEPRRNLTTVLLMLGLAAALLVFGNFYVDRPSVCGQCHSKVAQQKVNSRASHRDVTCQNCHREPGVTGFLTQRLQYLRWVTVSQVQGYETPIRSYVANNSCIRCHEEVTRKTVSKFNIRVRHKDFLDTGSRCTECHNSVGHTVEGAVKNPTMDKCILCHDGKKAESRCELCHVEDVGKDFREASRPEVKVVLERPQTCEGCHSTKSCFSCHQIEMPHSTEFLQGSHARKGFLDRSMCSRCHVKGIDFCKQCHGFPLEADLATHGGVEQGWASAPLHLGATKPGGCGCHTRSPDEQDKPSFCDRCHEGKGYLP